MKKLGISIAILLSSALTAMSQGSVAAANTNVAAGLEDKTTLTKNSKVEIPAAKARPITIPKVAEVITVDGKIDEEIWKTAAVFKDFYQTSPGNNTEVYMVYDEKHLYIAFRCFDEKDKIRATIAKRDNIFGEDNVRMWLDTYNDQRRAYVIAFNPHGIQQDGIYTEGQGADFSVDIVMESKGLIEDWGWAVEAKIPFKSLRYTAGKGKLWGFNVARNIDRFNDEFDQWLPDDRNVSGFLIKHGKITGLDGIKYERTLEIVPSVTVSETGRRTRSIPRYALTPGAVDPGRFVNEPAKADLGVTLKYTLSPNVTLDAAINPDFAEIEADAPVITANQRFPIFFQEKRPFFLEGQEIFSSPLQVFYSRNIVDPDLALKLTGKTGKTSFGFLAASDKAPGNYDEDDRNDRSIRPRIDEFLDKNALFAVMRIKRDFGKENNIGFFGTYRSFPEQKNLLGGIDGRIKISPKMSSVFQVAATNSRRCIFDPEFDPASEPIQAQSNREVCGGGTFGGVTLFGNQYQRYRTGNGVGYYANLDYTTEKHGWFAEIGGRSRDYRADSGFTRRVNTNFAFIFNRFSTKSDPKRPIIRASWAQFSGIDYDWSGNLQKWRAGTNVNLTLQNSLFVFFETGTSFEKLYEEEFGLKRLPARNGLPPRAGQFFGDPTRTTWQQFFAANVNQNVNKKFNYGAFVGFINNAYDYYFQTAGRQNPGPGNQFDTEIFAEYKPISPLRTSISYRKSRLVRDDNSVRSFDSDLVSLRSTYQFTRFLFVRSRLDYVSGSEAFSGQALVGWNPSPGTAFYVGYNDAANYNGFNPFTGQREEGFNRMSRTFFIRASYLFRKSF
jgi:hypothetical protein